MHRTQALVCGGCGEAVTGADVAYFTQQLIGDAQRDILLGPHLDALGVTVAATGDGRKTAIVVLGTKR